MDLDSTFGRSGGQEWSSRRGKVLRWAALALVLGLSVAGAAEARPDESDACEPLRAEASTLPTLQSGAEALCRAIAKEGPAGEWSERFRLRIGGWVDASYQDNDLGSGDHSISFDHVNLHVDARLDDRWKLFFEGEWEHEPDLLGGRDEREWELEQLYAELEVADSLRIRAGRFSTPFGIWTPVHWSILVDTIGPPIHEMERIVPEQQLGLRVFGDLFADEVLGIKSVVGYSFHGGYASSGLDGGNAAGLTLGSDLNLQLTGLGRLGVSLYTQRNEDEGNRREDNIDVYAEAELPFRLLARVEYVRQMRDETAPGLVRNVDIVYAKLRWDLRSDTYLNYRFEFGEDDHFGFSADHRVHRVTLGYSPIPQIRLKTEYAHHAYASRLLEDYHYWGVSAGLFF